MFSGVVKLSTPGGEQEVTVYNRKGIMEICCHSDQLINTANLGGIDKSQGLAGKNQGVMDSITRGGSN